jgi:hypothetical protein
MDERDVLTSLKMRTFFQIERDGDCDDKTKLNKLGELCDAKSLIDIFDYSLLTRKDSITAILSLTKGYKDIYKSLARNFDVATKSDVPLLAIPLDFVQSKPSTFETPISENTSLEEVIIEDSDYLTELIDIFYHQMISVDTTGLIYSGIIER